MCALRGLMSQVFCHGIAGAKDNKILAYVEEYELQFFRVPEKGCRAATKSSDKSALSDHKPITLIEVQISEFAEIVGLADGA